MRPGFPDQNALQVYKAAIAVVSQQKIVTHTILPLCSCGQQRGYHESHPFNHPKGPRESHLLSNLKRANIILQMPMLFVKVPSGHFPTFSGTRTFEPPQSRNRSQRFQPLWPRKGSHVRIRTWRVKKQGIRPKRVFSF